MNNNVTSTLEFYHNELISNHLPPYICNNLRKKIKSEDKISVNDIKVKQKVKENEKARLVYYRYSKPVIPSPLHPLAITWSPNVLSITLQDEEIIQKLWLWNSCNRLIYLHVCEFLNDTVRLGATWRCYPRTRLHLAPGMKGEIRIRAKPHKQSPVQCAYVGLQLAAAHMREHVIGYFLVPMQVKFLNYIPPILGDGE